MDVIDKVAASLPPEHRPWFLWCANEYDPINPYHEDWESDVLDRYGTDFPTRNVGIRWGLTALAVMCDATYGLQS